MEKVVDPKKYLEYVIVGAVVLAIAVTFFVLLDRVTTLSLAPGEQNPHDFTFMTIVFSVVVAALASFFLVWLKNFMGNRPYLGLIIAAIVLASVLYSLTYRFAGPYTVIFQIVIGLFTAAYVGYYFVRNMKNAGKLAGQSFDDS